MKNIIIDGVHTTVSDDATAITYLPIEEGDVLVTGEAINPENGQKLLSGLIHEDDVTNVEAAKFIAHTDKYYDWTSETKEMMETVRDLLDDMDDDGENHAIHAEIKSVTTQYLQAAERLGIEDEAKKMVDIAMCDIA